MGKQVFPPWQEKLNPQGPTQTIEISQKPLGKQAFRVQATEERDSGATGRRTEFCTRPLRTLSKIKVSGVPGRAEPTRHMEFLIPNTNYQY